MESVVDYLTPAMRKQSFLRPILKLNKDVLRKITVQAAFAPQVRNLAELVEYGIKYADEKAIHGVIDKMVYLLNSHQRHGVLYVADDHNAIFKFHRELEHTFYLISSFLGSLVFNSVRCFTAVTC